MTSIINWFLFMTFDFIICESVLGKQGEILFVFLFCLKQKGNENYLTIGSVFKSISGMERIKNSTTQAWVLCPHKWLLNLLFEILNTFTKGANTNRIARKLLLLLGWPKSSCELMRKRFAFIWCAEIVVFQRNIICFGHLIIWNFVVIVSINWRFFLQPLMCV